MSFPEINFQPKGPEAIRSRMSEIQARIEAPQREEFQDRLDKAKKGTPDLSLAQSDQAEVSPMESLAHCPQPILPISM